MGPQGFQTIIRVRLDLRELNLNVLSKCIWVSIDTSNHKTVYDFKNFIGKKFNISRSKKFELYLQQCLIPPDETIFILRDEDLVKICFEDSGIFYEPDSVNEFQENTHENQDYIGHKRKKHKSNKYDSISEICNEKAKVAELENNVELLKNGSYKGPSLYLTPTSQFPETTNNCNVNSSNIIDDISHKKKKKKIKNNFQNAVCTPEHSFVKLPLLPQVNENNESLQNTSNSTSNLFQNDSLNEMSTKNESFATSGCKKRRRHKKRKVSGSQETNLSHRALNSVGRALSDYIKKINPVSDVKGNVGNNSHIRFEDEKEIPKTESTSIISSQANDAKPNIKLQSHNLNVSSWNKIFLHGVDNKPEAVIMSEDKSSSKPQPPSQDFGFQGSKKIYDHHSLLKVPPSAGDTIAYKILELSDEYCPEVSDYKEAKVISFDSHRDVLEVELKIGDKKRKEGKFEIPQENENGPLALVTEVHWTSLIDPKLISSGTTEPKTILQ